MTSFTKEVNSLRHSAIGPLDFGFVSTACFIFANPISQCQLPGDVL